MSATQVDFTLYTGKSKILKLTVKDAADTPVDIASATGDNIYWVMQKGADDKTHHVYKDLSAGITKPGGTGIVHIAIDPADTAEIDASGGDLSYWHQMSVELSSQPDITMFGTATIKHSAIQVVNSEETEDAAEVGLEAAEGSLATGNSIDAEESADVGVSVDAGAILVTS